MSYRTILDAVRQVAIAAGLILMSSLPAWSQASQVPNAQQQFVDPNGNPYANGKVFMYVPSTFTKKSTWTGPTQTTQNLNPIQLDNAGRAVVWGVGSYRQVLQDQNNQQVWDNLTTAPASTPAVAGSGSGDFLAIGAIIAIAGFSSPVNYVLAYGQAISRTTYPDALTALTISSTANCTASGATLTGILSTAQVRVGAAIEANCLSPGTTIATIAGPTSVTVTPVATVTSSTTVRVFNWGNGNGVNTFNVPDLRGTVMPGADCMGGACASNLTAPYYSTNPGPPGARGGTQNTALNVTNLPPYTPAGSNGTVTAAGTVSTPTITVVNGTNIIQGSAGSSFGGGGVGVGVTITATSSTPVFTGTPVSGPTWTGTPQGGTSAAFTNIPPSLTVNYAIKVLNGTLPTVGVLSLGGMTGDILCDASLSCANQIIGLAGGNAAITALTGDCIAAGPGSVNITCTKTGGVNLGTMATQNANAISVSGGSLAGVNVNSAGATITNVPTPVNGGDAVNKTYADLAAGGIHPLPAVRLATAAVLPNTLTYANGAAGVGATLTAGSNGALSIDGTLTIASDSVLIKDQTSTTGCTVANAGCQNGVYTVTTVGTAGTPYVLTRRTDFDTAAEMLQGSYFAVTAGVTNISKSYTLQSTVATVGTTPAVFNLFSSGAVSAIGGMTGSILCGTSIVCGSQTVGLGTGFYNVKNATFGATGDGTTDDTAAIKAACTAAAVTGGTVYLPSGTYIITMVLNPGGDYAIDCSGTGVNIIGDGQGTTIIKNQNAAAVVSMLRASGTQQSVRNMTLDGNRLNGGGAIYAVNPNSAGVTVLGSHFTLDNVEIKNVETLGIVFGASTDYMMVSNNYIHDNGTTTDIWGAGIKMTNAPVPTGGIIKNNVIISNYGLTVPGAGGPNFGGGAIALDGTQMIVDGNFMKNNYNGGGQLSEGNAGGVSGVQRSWVFTNNVFLVNSEPALASTSGIEISGQNYTITGNLFEGGKGSCVFLHAENTFFSGNMTIAGNTCIGTVTGVVFHQVGSGVARFTTIAGNKFKGQTTGVDIPSQASQIGIFGNQFSEVTTPITNAAGVNEVLVEANIPATVGIPWTVNNSLSATCAGCASFSATPVLNYHLSAKSVFIQLNVTVAISTGGAGGIAINSLPFTLATSCMLSGRGNAVSGKMVQGVMGGTGGTILNYDSTYPGAAGEVLVLGGVCQVS